MNLWLTVSWFVMQGLKGVSRAIIHADEKTGNTYKLYVEGDNLKDVLATRGQFISSSPRVSVPVSVPQ